MRANKQSSGLVIGFCLLGLMGLAVMLPSRSEAVTNVGKAPKESVAQIKLSAVDGRQFSLAGLRGKVVVLDFFAIKCVHSRDHIIDTMNSYTDAEFDKGLQIIGVESESSSVEQVRRYIKDQRMIYPVAQVDEPTFIRYVDSRDLSAPQTLVFGRDGKLLLHTIGHSDKNEAAIKAAVQKGL